MANPFPPLAEQHRIVAKVDRLKEVRYRLEARLTASQRASRWLLEAVVQEAFKLMDKFANALGEFASDF